MKTMKNSAILFFCLTLSALVGCGGSDGQTDENGNDRHTQTDTQAGSAGTDQTPSDDGAEVAGTNAAVIDAPSANQGNLGVVGSDNGSGGRGGKQGPQRFQ